MDGLLLAGAIVALVLTVYLWARYGSVFRIGDTEHSHARITDYLAVFVTALAFFVCALLLALRRLAGGSITAQWQRDQELLRAARHVRAGDDPFAEQSERVD